MLQFFAMDLQRAVVDYAAPKKSPINKVFLSGDRVTGVNGPNPALVIST